MSRPVMAVLGAIGLLNITSSFLVLDQNIRDTIDAWQAVTRPVWDYLFGWLFNAFGIDFLWWHKDYLTSGLVFSGMYHRAMKDGYPDFYDTKKTPRGSPLTYILIAFIFWPIAFYLIIHYTYVESPPIFKKKSQVVFWETAIFFLIFIAANYALIQFNFN